MASTMVSPSSVLPVATAPTTTTTNTTAVTTAKSIVPFIPTVSATPLEFHALDLKNVQPLLLTYINYNGYNDTPPLPRMTSFLKGSPLDPHNQFNVQAAFDKMNSYLRCPSDPLPRNAMVQALQQTRDVESRKRRISEESMVAVKAMCLLNGGANPNNIGRAPSDAQEWPAFGCVANATAAMY